MNVDNLNSKYKVVSKYFTGKTVMDESLTDFKEKKSFKLAKNAKALAVKPKPKKVKQVKGQKDIRAALKQKNNELITYSKDFDTVCKTSGIDVDSEQLQLAIALSKSLQTSESTESSSDCSKSLTSQQRTGLIRSTLKEYGFKIPEKPNASKKTKKRRKPYKLLLTSDEEKQQIITDRYSQLLFELNNSRDTSSEEDLFIPNLFIYNISTNMEYKDIKDDSIFYVESLIEETPNTAGCLLKNWSDIPGRPLSPAVNKSELLFSEIECSQEEIDIVFSGTLKSSKAILKKYNLTKDQETSFNCSIVEQSVNKITIEPDPVLIEEPISPILSREIDSVGYHTDCSGRPKHFSMVDIDVKEKNLSVVNQPSRSLSPDLFDDEDDAVTEVPSEKMAEIMTELASNITNDIEMNLTECVNVMSQKNNDTKKDVKPVSKLSQQVDITKRKSDDFMETTECVNVKSQKNFNTTEYAKSVPQLSQVDVTKRKSDDFTEMTECRNVMPRKNDNSTEYSTSISKLSQPVNVTKRKSNDFMEMTECVGSNSQKILDKIDEHIDLTGNSENSVTADIPYPENGVGDEGHSFQPNDECIDLTAHSRKDIVTENTCENMNICATRETDDQIDLTGHCADIVVEDRSTNADHVEHMDLTQSSNSSTNDTLPVVHIGGKQNVSDKSLDDTIILNENEYLETSSPGVNNKEEENVCASSESPGVSLTKNDSGNQPTQLDKTETRAESSALVIASPKKMLIGTDDAPIINLDETNEAVGTVNGNIDLTQSSNSNEASNAEFTDISHGINSSSLGKKDDVSVDYDEALENMNSFPFYTHDENDDNSMDLNMQTPDKASNSNSRRSILDLSDNELTSHSKSKNVENNFDFGGISVIDNLPSFNRKSRSTLNSIPNGSMSDSLPMVNLKGIFPEKPKTPIDEVLDPVPNPSPIKVDHHQNRTNKKPNNVKLQTPQTKVNRHLNIETPDQNEYIVKTDNVTPMLDYASMSTPERNKELDKYGLKPFKRKRAIQLLTHLYNQTHPYVESTDEVTSPSKKRKKENLSQPSPTKSSSSTSVSPRNKSKSPRKTLKSPRKHSESPRKHSESPGKLAEDSGSLNESDKENELFLVTSTAPAIRNIECDEDDWVFQKREKAKLYSCRVPLHIAFHNYVSCRLRLHEAILRYEPVNIDVIHKELAASGHRYDPKDLLKFMDKKCITVKTADSAKNNKRC